MESIVRKFEIYLLAEKRVSQNTLDSYMIDINQFINFLKRKKINIKKIKLENLKLFLKFLKKDLEFSSRSIARKISSLKIFFAFLHREIGITNLSINLSFPKIEKRLPDYLTEAEIEKLLEFSNQDKTNLGIRNKIMLHLLYVTGMRITELVNLTISNIQFDTCFILVNGKGGKDRLIPIPKVIAEDIQNYLDTAYKNLYKIEELKSVDYLFPVLYGKKIKHISRQALWNIVKTMSIQSGINKPLSPHKLRHSLATHLLHKGANLRSIQLLLGHENLSTVQIYTHVDTQYLRKLYDKYHPRS